ncbi:MAG TPA: CmpA/NrtA family ABC transporter substrate-binding protein [Candidatus Binatia bacterium]|jgi:nitrate/nitrite transport system substrate-binding protein|nr:CmpA/NrtA family ABC transporter substrate-binding protein [Candidatus Binatia bacterium]
MKPKKNSCSSELNRRDFLARTAKGATLAALLAGLPKGWVGTAFASDAPETSAMKFGIIALTDCSPIVIAHEKGLFKKYGIDSTVLKGANWAAIRDNLSSGVLQATHMLIGMPIASTMGLAGSPRKPMIIPWLLNRNGQAITLKTEWKGKVSSDPKALKTFEEKAKKLGEPLTFAMTFPPGTHAMWMRYFLGAGGINPDKDVSLIVVPPAQMVSNMKIGKMDGFCVGEPWNARAITDGIGFTSVSTQDLWKDHPEKVCAFLGEFADKNPKTVKAVLKALHEASVWLDDLNNRPEQCELVSRATYINCDKNIILGRLQGHYDYGDGRQKQDEFYMHFSKRNCNYPQPKYCKWFLTQYRRWGLVAGTPNYAGIAKEVMRADIYEEAMKEIGYAHGGENNDPETLFDGVAFDPKGDLEGYAKGFAVNNLKG